MEKPEKNGTVSKDIRSQHRGYTKAGNVGIGEVKIVPGHKVADLTVVIVDIAHRGRRSNIVDIVPVRHGPDFFAQVGMKGPVEFLLFPGDVFPFSVLKNKVETAAVIGQVVINTEVIKTARLHFPFQGSPVTYPHPHNRLQKTVFVIVMNSNPVVHK
jgi:hypothetical protein